MTNLLDRVSMQLASEASGPNITPDSGLLSTQDTTWTLIYWISHRASRTAGHELRPVPHRLEFAHSVVPAAAGPHADQAEGELSQAYPHLLALDLLLQPRLAIPARVTHLDDYLSLPSRAPRSQVSCVAPRFG